MNTSTSKAAVAVNAILGKILSIIGYTLGSLIILSFFSGYTSTGEVIVAVVFIALCVVAVLGGMRIKRRIKRFKKYIELISARQITSLDDIAANTSKSVDFVRNDLQKMIDKKFFMNAAIDHAAGEIIIRGAKASAPSSSAIAGQAQGQGHAAQAQYFASGTAQASARVEREMETFVCSGCGATGIKIKGAPGSCEYCGSLTK